MPCVGLRRLCGVSVALRVTWMHIYEVIYKVCYIHHTSYIYIRGDHLSIYIYIHTGAGLIGLG